MLSVCRAASVMMQAHAELWAKDWNLNVADQRTLLFACAEILRISKVSARAHSES